jgi:potassium-transporting ATPase KdpC subunit
MEMKQQLKTAFWMTLVTTVLCGILYPVLVTALAQALFPARANGELIERDGKVIGSRLIGQPFSSPGYFHSRPSAAGNGYDALRSGGSNLGPTNRLLIERVKAGVRALRAENPAAAVPVDLVTASASGLDPDLSPAAADFQVPRVARERGMSQAEVRAVVRKHTASRQFGVLGEPRVNVLEVNLDLDALHPMH